MNRTLLEEGDREHKLLLAFAKFRLTQECAGHGQQVKVAGRLGVSQAHVCNIIKGRARITDDLLRVVTAEFGSGREKFLADAEAWAAEREAEKAAKRKVRKAS